MQEVFRVIKDFENYSVSNLGSVRNNKTKKILKPGTNKDGYYVVNLYNDNKKKTFIVHRLVAFAFLDNPHNKICIDHIDNNRLNNNVINLRWATVKENSQNRKISTRNTSGIKGVSFCKKINKYKAYIENNGKKLHLGYFDKIEDAVNARYEKAKELFGEFINPCEQPIVININIQNANVNINQPQN